MTETQTARFKVEDMTCGHCAGAVRDALGKALPGAEVSVDLENRLVSVAGDAGRAADAIRAAGYTPQPA